MAFLFCSDEQTDEPSLLEMLVIGECFGHAKLLHAQNGICISQGPSLVRATCQKLPGVQEERLIGVELGNARPTDDGAHIVQNLLAWETAGGHERHEFCEHMIG